MERRRKRDDYIGHSSRDSRDERGEVTHQTTTHKRQKASGGSRSSESHPTDSLRISASQKRVTSSGSTMPAIDSHHEPSALAQESSGRTSQEDSLLLPGLPLGDIRTQASSVHASYNNSLRGGAAGGPSGSVSEPGLGDSFSPWAPNSAPVQSQQPGLWGTGPIMNQGFWDPTSDIWTTGGPLALQNSRPSTSRPTQTSLGVWPTGQMTAPPATPLVGAASSRHRAGFSPATLEVLEREELGVLVWPSGRAVKGEIHFDFPNSFMYRSMVNYLGLAPEPIPVLRRRACFTPQGYFTPEWFVKVVVEVISHGISNVTLNLQVLEDNNDRRLPLVLGRGFVAKASGITRAAVPGLRHHHPGDPRHQHWGNAAPAPASSGAPGQGGMFDMASQSSYYAASQASLGGPLPPTSQSTFPPSWGQTSSLSQSPSGLFTSRTFSSVTTSEPGDNVGFDSSSYGRGSVNPNGMQLESDFGYQNASLDTASTPRLPMDMAEFDDPCG